MPRCRFTRTDAGVSPERSAISAPLMPSTSLMSSVSRYASGSARTVSRMANVSVSIGSPPASFVGQRDLFPRVAQVVGRPVAGDGGNPGAEGGRVAQLADAPVGSEKHLLDEIVDVAPRDAAEQDGVDHTDVVGVQAREGLLVAGRDGSNRRAEGGGPVGDRQKVTGGENASKLEHMLHSDVRHEDAVAGAMLTDRVPRP